MEQLFTIDAPDDLGRELAPIAESAVTKRLYAQTNRISAVPLNLLIVGEPGSGKTTLARWVVTQSRRRGPLVTLACTKSRDNMEQAMFGGATKVDLTSAPGAFESAHGGTMLLEDVDALDFTIQAAVVRTIESREFVPLGSTCSVGVDVRVVSTTTVDLQAATREGGFRADLFYRLSPILLFVPPLRERPEEIERFARRFLAEMASSGDVPELSNALLDLFRSVAWRRNLTQLREVLARAFAKSEGRPMTLDHVDVENLRSERRPEGLFEELHRARLPPAVMSEARVKRHKGDGAPSKTDPPDRTG